jgi:hypothetical protein
MCLPHKEPRWCLSSVSKIVCLRSWIFPAADWQQTPPSVQTLVLSLLKRLEVLKARLNQDSTISYRPPSTDSPYKKGPKASGGAARWKAGGQPGYPAHRQDLLTPTDTRVLTPRRPLRLSHAGGATSLLHPPSAGVARVPDGSDAFCVATSLVSHVPAVD